MNFKENIRIAIFSIRSNLMRSLLTMLGIIIGVAAVIAIITLGNGGRDFIVGMIRDMGSSVISINVNGQSADASDYITEDDMEAIRALESVSYASPVVMTMGNASTKTAEAFAIAIGGNEDIAGMMSAGMDYGRFYSADEVKSAARVVVLDSMGARTLFGYENPVGEKVSVTIGEQNIQLTVIGIMNSSMTSMMPEGASDEMSSMMGMGASCSLMIPTTLADILTGNSGRYEMCYITARSDAELETAGSAAMNILYARHANFGSDDYNLVNMATYIDLLDTVINVFTTFIAAVSAISLVVGGIGVMNIMLVTVTERTREIGIRKALGAKTSTILFQFLTESIILCLLGGLIGLLIGSVGAFTVAGYMGIPIDMKVSTVAIAVGFSTAIGVFFGIYPARRAAKMQPIDALRRM